MQLTWLPWLPIEMSWRSGSLPPQAGLYRIRRVGRTDLDYIGQTGMPLVKRLAMLRGILQPEMPYRDPHTAGPALWALRHATGCAFEVSVLPVDGDTTWRKGLEALAISLYRQELGSSPTVNFGRMPAGYRMSSGNNQRLVAANRRFRGGLTDQPDSSHLPSIAPLGPLTADVHATDWCGHQWSAWHPVQYGAAQIPTSASGLYRMRAREQPDLLYIGGFCRTPNRLKQTMTCKPKRMTLSKSHCNSH